VAAAGSVIVVRLKRRGVRAVQAGGVHQPGHAFAAVPVTLAAQLRMDPRGAVAALGLLVGLADALGELLVGPLPG
jgi:hypothetical protein